MRLSKLNLIASLLLVFLPLSAFASLVEDDNVDIVNDKDSPTDFSVDPGPPPGSLHFSPSANWGYRFFAEEIEITNLGAAVVFNDGEGIHFEDLDWGGVPGIITNISIGQNDPEWFDSELSFMKDQSTGTWSVWLEADGRSLAWGSDEKIELNFTVTHPVPEPSSFVLVGFGLGAAALATRRRRKNLA